MSQHNGMSNVASVPKEPESADFPASGSPSGPILLRNASKLAAEAPFVKFSDSKNSDISFDQGMMTRAMIQFGKMMESESRLS